jgi:uncharacterized protein YgiM (DUF1202 family)
MRLLLVATLLGGALLITVDRAQAAMLTFSAQPPATGYLDIAEQQMIISDYGVPAELKASEESTASGAYLVKLRATPARNGRVLMQINQGEKVMTDGKTYGDWTHVMYKNSDGWVLTKFLK